MHAASVLMANGFSLAQIASVFGVDVSTLRRWRAEAKSLAASARRELHEFEREARELA